MGRSRVGIEYIFTPESLFIERPPYPRARVRSADPHVIQCFQYGQQRADSTCVDAHRCRSTATAIHLLAPQTRPRGARGCCIANGGCCAAVGAISVNSIQGYARTATNRGDGSAIGVRVPAASAGTTAITAARTAGNVFAVVVDGGPDVRSPKMRRPHETEEPRDSSGVRRKRRISSVTRYAILELL